MTMRHIENRLAQIEGEARAGIALAESAKELIDAAKAKADTAEQTLRRIKGEVSSLREMVKESV